MSYELGALSAVCFDSFEASQVVPVLFFLLGARNLRIVGCTMGRLVAALLALALPSSWAVGTHELVDHVEIVWELPASTPSALLFLAHGCNHGAIDFWPHDAKCPECIGLPEEVRLVKAALLAGFAVIAISSADRLHRRCWDFQQDGPRVVQVLTAFRRQHALEAAPLVALGASSGGAFVLQLPQILPCACIVSQIMAVPDRTLHGGPRRRGMCGACQPPTLFVHMPRDGRTAERVRGRAHSRRRTLTYSAGFSLSTAGAFSAGGQEPNLAAKGGGGLGGRAPDPAAARERRIPQAHPRARRRGGGASRRRAEPRRAAYARRPPFS